jgi:ketosteroid isomerase-like protein
MCDGVGGLGNGTGCAIASTVEKTIVKPNPESDYDRPDVSENIELVKRSFEALATWDVEALLGLYDPDVRFLPLTGTRVGTGGYRGHDGVRAYIEEARELWDVLEPQGHEYVDLGDRVLVAGSCRFRGHSSGAESDPACAWVVGVRNGRIVSHRTCATYDEAVHAADVEPAQDHAR